jgi:IS5 family transposase
VVPAVPSFHGLSHPRPTELLNQNGHAAINATYFDRHQTSTHYLKRTGRSIRTIQATFLVDTAEGAILDLHCSTKWPSGMRIGPKAALRNAGDLRSLAADKGYNDMSFRDTLQAVGVRPLINTACSHRTTTRTPHRRRALSPALDD